jgi:hypothetical protein
VGKCTLTITEEQLRCIGLLCCHVADEQPVVGKECVVDSILLYARRISETGVVGRRDSCYYVADARRVVLLKGL